jgi:predicted DNA binding protein
VKSVRLTATPDPVLAPQLFGILAGAEYVTDSRLHDVNVSLSGRLTGLFEVVGDRTRFRNDVQSLPGVRTAETAPATGERFTLLLCLDTTAIPLLNRMFELFTRAGVVLATPVRYRDGSAEVRIVGPSAALRTIFEDVPSAVSLAVHEVGAIDTRRPTPIAGLSVRQREALLAASDLGYYDHPRRATHDDIADRLGCAPNTVCDHLQKAEKEIMAEVVDPALAP